MSDELDERIRALELELDGLPEPKTTWFLEPERATTPQLAAQIALASSSPIVDAVLKAGGGAIAVLNDRRQVLALNSDYLALLGVEEPGAALGLRPGEAVRCVHSGAEAPAGCGTGPACRTCGAAISILAAVEHGPVAERDCAFTLERQGALVDTEFRARAQRLEVGGERLIVLSLTDVSAERRRAALERAFFSDLQDLLSAVVASLDAMEGTSAELVQVEAADARDVATRIAQEVRLQRALMDPVPSGYAPAVATVPVAGIVQVLGGIFQHHPIAAGKRLRISGGGDGLLVRTDPYLVQRILTHMLVNAFEASPDRTEVALRIDAAEREIAFRVWNPGVIPPSVAPRIFQRYFTTKGDGSRGQGTFVMKYFGEKVLRGRVSFTSTKEAGTTFELRIPRSLQG
jgi:signal transduction histidine kinase